MGTGISILFTETCSSVTWGIRGAERAGTFTATCSDVVLEGAMSQFTAAGLAILAGCVLPAIVAVPVVRRRTAATSDVTS